jgi:hypothetical protein
MRSVIAATAAAGLAIVGGIGFAAPASAAEGCILASGTTQLSPDYNVGGESCTYTATAEGQYGGAGEWSLIVTRDGVEVCTDTDMIGDPCVIQVGDVVDARVGAAGSLIVGNATAE